MPNAADWLLAVNATERPAKDPGHFDRVCRDELAARGLALKASDASRPGPDRWYVNRAFDPRLAPDAPLQIGFAEPDLERFSGKQRDQAMQRRACVERLRVALATWAGPVKAWLPRLLAELAGAFPAVAPSRSQLYTWHTKYRGPADTPKPIDTRGGDRKSGSGAAAWSYFRGLYLHENRPSAAQCWRETKRRAAEEG